MVVEGAGELGWGEAGGDLGDAGDLVAEDEVLLPGAHGVGLDEAVGVFAAHAGGGEVEQELAGEDEAAGGFEVAQHALGVDEELGDEVFGFGEEVVGEDGGVGEDDPLGGGVGDVALVPEGDVLEGGLGVGADDACEAGDLLAGDGVALVRHGGGAFLFFGEELLDLADLGALEMANLGGDLVERRAEDGERRDVGRVAVALNDLRGDGDGGEAEFFADGFLMLGLEVAECADGAGELADAQVFGGGVEAGEVALHLGVPEEELEAEGGGLGVDAVGAADDGGVLELDGAGFQGFGEREDSGADQGRGFAELEGLRGVDDVGGGEAEVEPAGGFGVIDVFGDGGGEGDDVVADFGLDFEDAGDGEVAAGGDGVGGGLGDEAEAGEGLGGGGLDGEPGAELVFVGPDAAHGRTCVTGDHKGTSGKRLVVSGQKRLYAEEGGHFVVEEAATGTVGLNPTAVEDELGDGALAGVGEDFGCRAGGGLDVDVGVGDGVGGEETLGLATVAAPGGGVDEEFHASILREGATA